MNEYYEGIWSMNSLVYFGGYLDFTSFQIKVRDVQVDVLTSDTHTNTPLYILILNHVSSSHR